MVVPLIDSSGAYVASVATGWTLDNWGEILIACPDRDQPAGATPFQPIYQWDPNAAFAVRFPIWRTGVPDVMASPVWAVPRPMIQFVG